MIHLAVLLLVQAPATAEPQTVVVTATYARLLADLRRCEDGECGTREDIQASVRLAEAAFRKGDYLTARNVLRRSVDRNKAAAPNFPEAVSNLYFAQAKVAQHYGDEDEQLKASMKSYAVMRDHRPSSAERFRAEMEAGDLLLARGRLSEARHLYASAVSASAQSSPLLSNAFKVRLAWADYQAGSASRAKRALESLKTETASSSLVNAIAILQARIARDEGDHARSDQLLAAVRATTSSDPLLLSQAAGPSALIDHRPIDVDPVLSARKTSVIRSEDSIGLKWVDVGYWIRPDGTVSDPEILRGNGDRSWARPLLNWVLSRRYAPSPRPVGDPGNFHLERFTQTAEFVTPIGSIVRRRAGRRSIVSTEIKR